MLSNWKTKINYCFDDVESLPGKSVDIIIVMLVFVVSIIMVLKTYTLSPKTLDVLDNIENSILAIFVLEYILRIWSAPNRIKRFLEIYSIVDLIAIIPFFFAANTYQVLRVFRALRILRLARFLQGKHFFFKKLTQSHIIIVKIVFIIVSIIFVSSEMILIAEYGEEGSKIKTFFDAVYFSIITLTTVGYGDITPVTKYGRFVTLLIVISGIIFIPWQVKELIKQFMISVEKIIVECQSCGQREHDVDANYCKICSEALKKWSCLN